MEHALAAATFRDWWRGLRDRRSVGSLALGGRWWTFTDALIVALVLYVVVITFMRFFYAFAPWTMEGDWKQWIWQYHRYWIDGAFPPGHVITDYQFRVQPTLYFAVMAALSHVMHPGVAARILALLAWGLILFGAYQTTTKLSHWLPGLAAVVFVSHDFNLFSSTTGGYPRSFGPALVLLLLDAWLGRRHATAVALLVVMAALYPSVLPPCGLAYGGWVFFAALREGRRAWLIKVGSLALAAVASAGLALTQNVLALPWWGAVITLTEAERLPALHPGGRMRWLPFGDYFDQVGIWLVQPYAPSGALAHFDVHPWPAVGPILGGLLALALLVVVLVRRRRGVPVRVPWEILLLVGAALFSYFVARELAFRLYLPLRVLQHIVPICVIVAVPALAYQACRGWESARGLARALLLTLAPVFVLSGDGFLFPGWGSYAYRAPELQWIKANTPITAQFAGDIATLDIIPYFTARPVYVNWTMAHPFRLGYWQEMERRLLRNHDIMYANDKPQVLRFLAEEKIDYLVLDPERFVEPDTGRKLFHPIRDKVLRWFQERRPRGFVLASPPVSAVVYSDEDIVIIDAARLREAWGPRAERR